MATNALAYGIGAVISHTYEDGSERPIAYASRTLSKADKLNVQRLILAYMAEDLCL